MSDLDGTTRVVVELRDRKPTIEDVRAALDTLTAEGIPETFEVSILQSEDREYIQDVPFDDRPVKYLFRVQAERAARSGPA